jgi:predicted MPP superfamily phosphohydrolase
VSLDKRSVANHSAAQLKPSRNALIHAPSDWASRRLAIENSAYWVGPDGRYSRWRKRLFGTALAVVDTAIRPTPLYRLGRRNALDLSLVEFDVDFADLPPAFDGYRILHVSDTHLDVFPELAPAARKLLDGVEVDMLALTGDVHGSARAPVARSVALLGEALGSARVHGQRLAVLGNHDPVDMADALAQAGFDVLANRSLVVRRADGELRITGLDDVHNFYTDAARAALDDHAGEFRIALVHSAEVADHADEAGYALYLCGHTHGGQICLPGGRPVVTHLKRCRHAARGLWRQGRMTGYTSCGLGVATPSVRFNSRGEVTLITLRRPR